MVLLKNHSIVEMFLREIKAFLRLEAGLTRGNVSEPERDLRQILQRLSEKDRQPNRLFGLGFFQLRYEDLLAKPEENLKAMFELLGARSDEGVRPDVANNQRTAKLK